MYGGEKDKASDNIATAAAAAAADVEQMSEDEFYRVAVEKIMERERMVGGVDSGSKSLILDKHGGVLTVGDDVQVKARISTRERDADADSNGRQPGETRTEVRRGNNASTFSTAAVHLPRFDRPSPVGVDQGIPSDERRYPRAGNNGREGAAAGVVGETRRWSSLDAAAPLGSTSRASPTSGGGQQRYNGFYGVHSATVAPRPRRRRCSRAKPANGEYVGVANGRGRRGVSSLRHRGGVPLPWDDSPTWRAPHGNSMRRALRGRRRGPSAAAAADAAAAAAVGSELPSPSMSSSSSLSLPWDEMGRAKSVDEGEKTGWGQGKMDSLTPVDKAGLTVLSTRTKDKNAAFGSDNRCKSLLSLYEAQSVEQYYADIVGDGNIGSAGAENLGVEDNGWHTQGARAESKVPPPAAPSVGVRGFRLETKLSGGNPERQVTGEVGSIDKGGNVGPDTLDDEPSVQGRGVAERQDGAVRERGVGESSLNSGDGGYKTFGFKRNSVDFNRSGTAVARNGTTASAVATATTGVQGG